MRTKRKNVFRRISVSIVSLFLIMTLTSCGDYGDQFGVDYGHSNIYTDDEIKAAVDETLQIFSGFTGCEMHNIRYLGDNYSMDEYFNMMNEMYPDNNYTQIIVFTSDFHTPKVKNEYDWWDPDKEYRDYRWVLARVSSKDRWAVINYGTDCLNP